MDGRLTQTNCDEAGDYVVPNVLSPRDLVSRPDNVDETVLSSPCSETPPAKCDFIILLHPKSLKESTTKILEIG